MPRSRVTFFALLCLCLQLSAHAIADQSVPSPLPESNWLDDYGAATRAAVESQKLLLIFFHEKQMTADGKGFQATVNADDELQRLLREHYVVAKLPVDTAVKIDGNETTLLEHSSFGEMRRGPGIAIVDFAHPESHYYRHVVSVFPFATDWTLDRDDVNVLLTLPAGSLTQRTLIFAVRTHPEAPHSTDGQLHDALAEESSEHSFHQASINLQGHHNWSSRFQRINARLANGTIAQEVCAESWPGQNLVDAAIECVHSWRQSSGHWRAVSSHHPFFGYDMKRGSNGVWYATGIFAHR